MKAIENTYLANSFDEHLSPKLILIFAKFAI